MICSLPNAAAVTTAIEDSSDDDDGDVGNEGRIYPLTKLPFDFQLRNKKNRRREAGGGGGGWRLREELAIRTALRMILETKICLLIISILLFTD